MPVFMTKNCPKTNTQRKLSNILLFVTTYVVLRYTILQTKTKLNVILCNRSFFNNVNEYCILEESSFSSTSDHLPVLMSIDLHVKYNFSCKKLITSVT